MFCTRDRLCVYLVFLLFYLNNLSHCLYIICAPKSATELQPQASDSKCMLTMTYIYDTAVQMQPPVTDYL